MANSKEASWVREHPALLISAGAAVFLVIKVLRVSYFDLETALSLLGTASPLTMFLGSFLVVLPVLFLILFNYLVFWLVDDVFLGSFAKRHLPAIAAMILLILVMPWRLALFGMVFLGLYVLFRWKFRPRSGTDIGSLVGSAILIYVILSTEMWLPAEKLDVPSQPEFVGYVIGESSEWTTVLREKERSIIRIPTRTIASREPCNLLQIGERTTLLDLGDDTSDLKPNPQCFMEIEDE